MDRVEREVELLRASHLRLHEAWGSQQVETRTSFAQNPTQWGSQHVLLNTHTPYIHTLSLFNPPFTTPCSSPSPSPSPAPFPLPPPLPLLIPFLSLSLSLPLPFLSLSRSLSLSLARGSLQVSPRRGSSRPLSLSLSLRCDPPRDIR